MRYNHQKAENEFRKEWEKNLAMYIKAGMSTEQIEAIYEFDREVFNSDRRYYEHCCREMHLDANDPLLCVPPEGMEVDATSWIELLPQETHEELKAFPVEYLRAFYFHRVCGYTQEQISSILLKPRRTICLWVGRIAEIIDKSRK